MSLRAQRHRILNSTAHTASAEYGVILNNGARHVEFHYTFQSPTGTNPTAELRLTSNHEGNDIPVLMTTGSYIAAGNGVLRMDFPPAEMRLMIVIGGTTPSWDVTLEMTVYQDE